MSEWHPKISLLPFVCLKVKKRPTLLKGRSYHNPKSTLHTINYNTWVHSCTHIENYFLLLLFATVSWTLWGPGLPLPLFPFKPRNQLHLSQCSMWNTLSFFGNAVVRAPFFVVSSICSILSLTHAPIFHRSMWMLWMQRNIWFIAAATFKMITMSSARSACVLSAVKPKQTRMTAAVLILHLANLWCVPDASYKCKCWNLHFSCGILRRNAPFWSIPPGIVRVYRVRWGWPFTVAKMAAPVKRFIFYVFVPRWSF